MIMSLSALLVTVAMVALSTAAGTARAEVIYADSQADFSSTTQGENNWYYQYEKEDGTSG